MNIGHERPLEEEVQAERAEAAKKLRKPSSSAFADLLPGQGGSVPLIIGVSSRLLLEERKGATSKATSSI